MASISSLLVIILAVVSTSDSAPLNVTYGGCESEDENCTTCYLMLKESLLKRDRNIQNLNMAFFPPKDNLPDFVTVIYCFSQNCSITQKWFWTRDSSYLFFPIESFQYLSLFFGKPAVFFSQTVYLWLDEECNSASNVMITLLTQRLKNFVQRASFDPVIDDNYFARAEKSDEDDLETPRARYILSFYAVGLFFAIIIAAMLLVLYLNTKRWDLRLKKAADSKKINKYIQSRIFSLAATSFFINLYALMLDGVAINSILGGQVPINEHYLHALPYIVTAIDGFGILWWSGCWTFSLCSFVCQTKQEYLGLAVSTVGPSLSLAAHLPYIVIAYLNDASYATSIFIYYTVIICVLLGIFSLTYGTCQGAILNVTNNGTQVNHVEGAYCCCPNSKLGRRCIFAFIIPLFAVTVLVFAGMITAALVVVPISKAFSDVPNRLLGFYQTAAVLVGAYLVYLNFLKKYPSIDRVVREREAHIETDNTHWEQLSRTERVAEFYKRCVEIVVNWPIGQGLEGGLPGAQATRHPYERLQSTEPTADMNTDDPTGEATEQSENDKLLVANN